MQSIGPPRISIITPSFNRAVMTGQAIESALLQTHLNVLLRGGKWARPGLTHGKGSGMIGVGG
jgi:hypothetical protein